MNENGLKRKRRKKREKRQRDGVPENGRSKNGISDSNGGALSRENGEIVANSAGKERRKRDAFKLKRMNSPLSMQSEDYASHPLPKQTKKHSKIEPISSVNGDVEPVPEGTSTSSSSAHPNKNPRARARQRTLMPSNTESSNLRKVATTRNAEGRTGTTVSQNTAKSSAASRHHTYPHPHHRHHHQSSRGGFPNPIQAIFSEGVYQLKKRSNSTARYRSSGTESGSHTTGNGLLHGNTGFPRTDTLFSRRSGLGRVGTRLATSREMTEGDLENGATDNGGNRSGSNNQRNDDAKPKRQVSLPASAYRFGRNSTVKDLSRDAHQKLAQLEVSHALPFSISLNRLSIILNL